MQLGSVLYGIGLMLTLLLTGCSGSKEKIIPPTPLKAVKTTLNVQSNWQVATDSFSAKQYVKLHPYVDDRAVYAAGGQQASAWRKDNGAKLWQRSIGAEVTGGVNGGQGMVFVGTSRGDAIALDADTGEVKWSERLSSEVLAVSEAAQGMVVFRTNDGRLHGLSTSTGETLWRQLRKTPALSLRGVSVPLVVGGMVVAGFDNGKVTAFDLKAGNTVWEATVAVPRGSSDIERMIDVDGRLKILGSALFAAAYHGRIVGIDMNTGKIHWSDRYSSFAGLDVDKSGVYTSSEKGDVWRLDPQTGKPVWKMDDFQRRLPTAPIIVGKHIVISDFEGYIHWVTKKEGKIVARTRGDEKGYNVAPVVEGKTVYLLGKSGVLSAQSL